MQYIIIIYDYDEILYDNVDNKRFQGLRSEYVCKDSS